MAKYINWKSNWFNSNFELFVDGIQKGAIKFNSWTSNAEAGFEDQHYLFTNVGFWQSKTNVIDRKTNELIAIITYDSWKSKAIISMKSGEQYEWKPTSFGNQNGLFPTLRIQMCYIAQMANRERSRQTRITNC